MSQPKKHVRINDILLGPLDRPALAWLVTKMPHWVTPDLLTYTGFFASILIFVSYLLCKYNPGFVWLASFGFILNWFGDSLDGNLARYRHIERPKYGFYLDHCIDAISQFLVFLGLGLSGLVKLPIALFTLIGYYLMDILVYITTYINGTFRMSYGKLGPTEVRVIAILINSIVFFTHNPIINLGFLKFTLFELVVGIIAFLFYYFFTITFLRDARKINQDEQAEKRTGDPKH
jgi:archaetidylinositol phosphate synthase